MNRVRLALAAALVAASLLAPAPRVHAAETRTFVYATDFGSGALSNIAFGPPRTVTTNVASVCSDAVLRYGFGHLAVVERFGCDAIRLVDPTTYATIREFSVGNGSNPNDYYETAPTKAYVARYYSTDLWIVDPSTGAHTGTIPLGAFADHDGIPEMNRLAYEGGHLFVSCQRLDRDNFFSPTDSSLVVVIDCATDAVVDCDPIAPGVQGILLPFTNPTTAFAVAPDGDLLLGCTGNFGVNDGGVVRIDPRTLKVAGVEATEADLGGDVNAVAVNPLGASGTTKAFCVVSDASFNTLLVSYQRATGHGVHVVRAGAGFVYADAKVSDRDELWLCDRTGNAPGVRVFAAANDSELTTSPLGVGLPPQDLAFDAVDPVAVGPAPDAQAGGLAFVSAAPNPAGGGADVAVRLAVDRPGLVHVLVADTRGRLVHCEVHEVTAPGELVLKWNGQADDGFRVPAGVYLMHAYQRGGGETATIRLIRLSAKGQP